MIKKIFWLLFSTHIYSACQWHDSKLDPRDCVRYAKKFKAATILWSKEYDREYSTESTSFYHRIAVSKDVRDSLMLAFYLFNKKHNGVLLRAIEMAEENVKTELCEFLTNPPKLFVGPSGLSKFKPELAPSIFANRQKLLTFSETAKGELCVRASLVIGDVIILGAANTHSNLSRSFKRLGVVRMYDFMTLQKYLPPELHKFYSELSSTSDRDWSSRIQSFMMPIANFCKSSCCVCFEDEKQDKKRLTVMPFLN
ncbi:MAG: hypothetical protein OXC30_03970 [Alphaproteobacteria bacterium]|nr:hypothetical protein [Alphaproteobacteria bacterium]